MQVTIPLRFLFLVAHFVSVLAVLFNSYSITAEMTGVSSCAAFSHCMDVSSTDMLHDHADMLQHHDLPNS